MKKKLLALLCVLSVLIGVLALSATAESATEDEKFYVGYAKVDINPYYLDEEGNYTDKDGNVVEEGVIMPVPLRGLGSPQSRLAYEYLIDDNGSGEVDYMAENGIGGDGLFLTCIAISNSKDSFENAVFLFTMDAIGDMGHTAAAREAIVNKLGATYGVAADQIMVSGTHSHSGVDLTQLDVNSFKTDTVADVTVVMADGESSYEISGATAYGYLQTYWDRLINKFVVAAEAAIDDCTEATVKKGQIEVDQSTAASAKTMNFVRHYVAEDGSNGYDYVMDTYSNQYNPKYDDVSYLGHVSEVDQTLHTISFEFDASTDKTPIALINWRNHPQFSSGSAKYIVSSDYINAFRYKMEKSGYRPAFFQGTGGNTQPTSRISGESGFASNLTGGLAYGDLLADVTLECLESNMSGVATGKVQTMQNIYAEDRIEYSEYHYNAAIEALAAENAGTWPITEEIYNSSTGTYEDRTKADPYKYTYTDDNDEEQTICISSPSQAKKIKEHYTNYSIDGLKTIDLEIDTILIGPQIAIVTCPGEPFDRYSQEAANKIKELWNDSDGIPITYEEYYAIANEYNDWDNLQKISNAQFGEPLIFGYSNQHITYIPNALAYNYNAEHPELYSTSSYESFMTPLAEGGGERMVANLATMLNQMVNSSVEACEGCGRSVTWYDLSLGIDSECTHYYLSDDMTTTQLTIPTNTTICVDLNGHTLSNASATSSARVFNVTGGTLNILDTSENKTGKVVGSCAGGSGGAISVASATNETGTVVEGTVNIYGGEISNTQKAAFGGVVYMNANSTVNIYGGKIKGGEANRFGGAICVAEATSKLNVYGGEITAGTAGGYSDDDVAKGHCVAFRNGIGQVTVGGDAKIDEIAYIIHQSSTAVGVAPTADTFKIVATDDSPAFTGSVTLNASGIEHGATVGSAEVLFGRGAAVTISSGYDVVMNEDKQLIAVTAVGGAAGVVDQNEDITSYGTLAEAITNVGDGYVILGVDVEELTVSSDITIDLNGRNITNLTVAENATVKLKDSKTADYFIGDQVYGVVETISGNVVAADNYLAVTDTEGTSYHCYKMKLSDVVLRPGRCGIYYKSEFDGDAMVVSQIESFGTALRIGKAPDVNSMSNGTYSAFAPEDFGGESNSTILVDILKSSNILSTNQHNANLQVHGRSYIKLTDGSYLFTDVKEEQVFSLRTLVETVSATVPVDELQANEDLMEMYRKFSAVMTGWEIQSIRDAYAANQAAEDAVLKVLLLGNSHSQDSFWHLTNIIEQEGIPAGTKVNGTEVTGVEIGVLYHGGCYMYEHASFAKNNLSNYQYYHKFSYADGKASARVDETDVTMQHALTDERWDIVVLQEMNMDKGIAYDSHTTDTQYVVDYVKRTLGYSPKFMWNMVWSNVEIPDLDYADATNEWIYDLANPGAESWETRMDNYYNNDAQTQHNKMVSYVDKYIVGKYGISEENVVSPGTAVMYALNELNLSDLTSATVGKADGDVYDSNEKIIYRDYTHLSDAGRVMAGYLWYAKLFGLEQIDDLKYTEIPYVAQQINDPSAEVQEVDALDISAQAAWIKEAVNATLSDRHCAVTTS